MNWVIYVKKSWRLILLFAFLDFRPLQLMPIPEFGHNGVLPPHRGDPTRVALQSPYKCTTVELVKRFGHTADRRRLLSGFLDFRHKMRNLGMINAFQWVDGSFVEDVERTLGRPPQDIDVLTVYWDYKEFFQEQFFGQFREGYDTGLAKKHYGIDHRIVDASHRPHHLIEELQFIIQLFSHNRNGVWKGILKLDVNTPNEDAQARELLEGGLT